MSSVIAKARSFGVKSAHNNHQAKKQQEIGEEAAVCFLKKSNEDSNIGLLCRKGTFGNANGTSCSSIVVLLVERALQQQRGYTRAN